MDERVMPEAGEARREDVYAPMYKTVICLSKKQVRFIKKGKVVEIARGKKTLRIAMKGYSNNKIDALTKRIKTLQAKIDELRAQ